MKRGHTAREAYESASSDDGAVSDGAAGTASSSSDAEERYTKKKQRSQRARETKRMAKAARCEDGGTDSSTSPVTDASDVDDEHIDDGDTAALRVAPSTESPHLLTLLNHMLPRETVAQAIVRLSKQRDKAASDAARKESALSLDSVMTAATALCDPEIDYIDREALLPRTFKALRRKPPKAWALAWSTADAAAAEALPCGSWLGPFTPERMETWRTTGFFDRKPALVLNLNAMPRESPQPAAKVASFL